MLKLKLTLSGSELQAFTHILSNSKDVYEDDALANISILDICRDLYIKFSVKLLQPGVVEKKKISISLHTYQVWACNESLSSQRCTDPFFESIRLKLLSQFHQFSIQFNFLNQMNIV